MDMNVSALALANSSEPELAGFRYLYSGFRRHSRDQNLPAGSRKLMFQQIRERLAILPARLRADAIRVVKDKDRPYWFAPEWQNPSALIRQHGGAELEWTYMQMSGAAHGTFLGLRLYREDPDQIDINPEPKGPRGLLLDLSSCRSLLEILTIRDSVEVLSMRSEIQELKREISKAALG
jgi:hypothetical protein